MPGPKNSWDKQETETNRAYNAFLTYRNMGALRSLSKASAEFYSIETTSKQHQFARWSSAHNWVSRCSDFDIEEERLRIEQKRERIRKMNENQEKNGIELEKIGMAQFKLNAGEKAYDTDEKGKHKRIKASLTVIESLKANADGVKQRRVAVGEVTEIQGHKGELGIKVIEIRTQERED